MPEEEKKIVKDNIINLKERIKKIEKNKNIATLFSEKDFLTKKHFANRNFTKGDILKAIRNKQLEDGEINIGEALSLVKENFGLEPDEFLSQKALREYSIDDYALAA